ncbi:hypothetical protein [Escherichia coli]
MRNAVRKAGITSRRRPLLF